MCDFDNAVARDEVARHIRAAQIEIAVFQPQLGAHVAVFFNFKRRRLCRRENFQLRNGDFDFARWQIFVDCAFPAGAYPALCQKDIFRARGKCLCKYILIRIRVKCQLNDAAAVAQIDKNQAAEVPLPLAPAHHGNLFADIRFAKLCTITAALVVFGK